MKVRIMLQTSAPDPLSCGVHPFFVEERGIEPHHVSQRYIPLPITDISPKRASRFHKW